MDSIARTCLGALANAARLRNAFVPLLDDLPIADRAASVLEVIHYNPQRGTDPSDTEWGCEAHEDQGLLTVIYSPLSRGLEVLYLSDASYHSICDTVWYSCTKP